MSEVSKRVYDLLRKVPKGKVTTYGELARAAGTSPRAVGKLMNVNPFAPEVPCHRVVMSDGRLGGFASGVENKIKLLKKEGVEIKSGKIPLNRYFKALS